MFQPLKGHPEAGHIVFTGTYSQNQQGEGVIEFTISNVTRQSLGVMKYMPGAESFGRYAQVDQWKEVMANVADFFGKNVSHASSSIAIREWDKETQSQGKWKSSESKVLTQDINKIRERRINARIRLEKEYERQKMWWTQPKY